jgi:hypothetical protein
MAYFVDVSEGPAATFLAELERTSPAMRAALEDSLEANLGQGGDHYCLTESYRIRGTSRFQFFLILADPGTGRLRRFRVVARDESAPVGVLKVLYLDEATP